MGNQKFKLLDMMPNSWFFKLKGIIRAQQSSKRSHQPRPRPKPLIPFTPNRASYYYPSFTSPEKLPNSPSNPKASDTQFPIDPQRNSKRRIRAKSTIKSITSSVSSFHSESYSLKEQEGHLHQPVMGFKAADFSIRSKSCLTVSELKLRPIVTDKARGNKIQSRKSPIGLHRKRLSTSPRFASKKFQTGRRSSGSPARVRNELSESFVVMKSSLDPQREFRESMVEMIVENNIRKSKDLEELLVCYLMLNSREYHDVIVNVFEKIWFQPAKIVKL